MDRVYLKNYSICLYIYVIFYYILYTRKQKNVKKHQQNNIYITI